MESTRKHKATSIGPYLFHLYVGQEVLRPEEMVAHNIGLDLLKYNYTLKSKPDQPTSSRPDPQPSSLIQRSNQKPSDRLGSSQNQDTRGEDLDLIQHEIEEMSHSFTNAIRWMEIAKLSYDQMGDVVVDVCKA